MMRLYMWRLFLKRPYFAQKTCALQRFQLPQGLDHQRKPRSQELACEDEHVQTRKQDTFANQKDVDV